MNNNSIFRKGSAGKIQLDGFDDLFGSPSGAEQENDNLEKNSNGTA